MKRLVLVKLKTTDDVESFICSCQRGEHIQQVAYSTFHRCLTQICFDCKKVRTNIDLKEKKKNEMLSVILAQIQKGRLNDKHRTT